MSTLMVTGAPLADWSFDDLTLYNQTHILMAIPTRKFNDAVFYAMDLTLRWKHEREEAAKAKMKAKNHASL